MRKPALILVILGLLFLGLTVINAATVELPVTEVREPVLAATASVQYLTDNSLNTVWEADGSQTARAELNLAETALIEGIQLYGEYQGNLVIEYWDNAGWHSFMASYLKSPPAPDWNLIDLSYDQVRTDRIRLTLVNPGNLQKLGGIKEIKVLGQPVTTILQRLEPAEVIGNSRTDKNFPAELLFDRNTYTAWQVTAGTTPAEAVVDLGTTCTLKYIKFFSKSAVNQYRLEYDQNGQWRVLTGEGITMVPDCSSGWRRINLEHYEINTARLRLVLPGYSALSGPGEVEIWGYREQGDGDQPYLYLDSGLISLRPEAPLNYAFSLKQRPGAALLYLITTGEPSTLSWELDGQAQGELQPVLEKAGKHLYQQLIFADRLGAGEHFLRIRGAAGSLIDCRLELLKEQPLPNTALTDRWTLTPGRGGTTLINFQKNLQIDELNVKYLG
ncbi:MAG TPA: discoidin domain-containing protein, partial [Bacillota bacterium]